jgi:hypothetical protein
MSIIAPCFLLSARAGITKKLSAGTTLEFVLRVSSIWDTHMKYTHNQGLWWSILIVVYHACI